MPLIVREHCQLVHNGRKFEFVCDGVSRFRDDLLSQQMEEAVKIDHQQGTSLNNKSEFVQFAGVSLSVAGM